MSTELATVDATTGEVAAVDPAAMAANVVATAEAMKALLKGTPGLVIDMGRDNRGNPREFVTAQGWQVAGSLVGGVTSEVVWSRVTEEGAAKGPVHAWEARVQVSTGDGLVAVMDAMAEPTEPGAKWTQTNHGVRAMASTRAQSRALRAVLGRYVSLGGFEGGTAEEVGAAEPVGTDPAAAARVVYQAVKEETGKETADAMLNHVAEPEALADPFAFARALVNAVGEVAGEQEEAPEGEQLPHGWGQLQTALQHIADELRKPSGESKANCAEAIDLAVGAFLGLEDVGEGVTEPEPEPDEGEPEEGDDADPDDLAPVG